MEYDVKYHFDFYDLHIATVQRVQKRAKTTAKEQRKKKHDEKTKKREKNTPHVHAMQREATTRYDVPDAGTVSPSFFPFVPSILLNFIFFSLLFTF